MKKLLLILMIVASVTLFANNKKVNVTIKTTYGDIGLELYPDAAPKTVKNFIRLAKEGFYDSTYFHRVIPNFMIQAGDPNTKNTNRADDGMGGPGYKFDDEISAKALGLDTLLVKHSMLTRQFPKNHPYQNITVEALDEKKGSKFNNSLPSIHLDYGVIAMANAGPNTNGSQFFIITAKRGTPWLDGHHTGFGRVISGIDVCHTIEHLPKDRRDNPLPNKTAYILKIIVK